MKESYLDIRSRIDKDPVWYDENGAPRYDPFSPEIVATFYASEACLLHISCQGCGREFHVALSKDKDLSGQKHTLADIALAGNLHYGDPPNVGCCDAGASMNSVPIRCVEFWEKAKHPEPYGWKRRQDLEIEQSW